MRRIATTLALLLVTGVALAATAGADDKRTYQAELFNAFGLVEGSELRVAGVTAGTVKSLDITPEKTALITFEVGPGFPEFKSDASCSSEPQSLIAEYFLDCQPGSASDPLEGPIEASRNQTTVQNDLVQNTLREPFKRRFQLILNEFGTALVGNAENLNAAIRAGAPALRELRKVLNILGRQNTLIAQLNVDSDQIFAKLTERREDVVRFIDEAEDAGRVSAERREDLARDFDLLDDFLFELRPVMHELGNLARAQTPLLTDLRAAAPGLNKLGRNLPDFNRATELSLEALGDASEVGTRAVSKSREEIAELNTASQKAQPAADIVADFLESLDDPRRAVEEDCDARYDLREQPGEADRRVALLEDRLGEQLTGQRTNCGLGNSVDMGPGIGNPGYTGLEGLLNYAYVQTAALNLFDQAGHALAIQVVGEGPISEGGECGEFSPGGPLSPDGQHGGWPKAELFGGGDGSNTRDPSQAAHCVGILGDYQPGVSFGTVDRDDGVGDTDRTQFNPATGSTPLPAYDPVVCSPPIAKGTTNKTICSPSGDSADSAGFRAQGEPPATPPQEPSDETVDDVLEKLKEKPDLGADLDEIRDQLGLPPGAQLPPEITDAIGLGSADSAGADSAATRDLLDFLFAP